ncbi:P68 family surface lipoprotein [Mycoplasma sp. E35C]|uniref:P68 family surface lipoprotein n=1 Tax=Mycoplasma sp. E35C TaxID=2801918 RepID=UPI001CA4386A|nr:P80 family lipoprotein [Mycoplasma sp. E35C]QZX49372.1 hypothetical protein JJE79_01320 [Mycoplasma sp. E35C]
MRIRLKKAFISSITGLGLSALVISSCTPTPSTRELDGPQKPNPDDETNKQTDPIITNPGDENINKPRPRIRSNEKIIFQTAQGDSYPQIRALKVLVDLYNQEFEDDQEHLDVVLQNREITKARSEVSLTRNTVDLIKKEDDKIPNLILGSLNSVNAINDVGYGLNLNKSKILKRQNFEESIFDYYNTLNNAKKDSNDIYGLPFSITTFDSLVYNKPLMNLIFKFVKDGGGMVDEHSKIYQELKQDDFLTKIPKTKRWNDLEVKNREVFKNLVVNDDTFGDFESIIEFSNQIAQGLKLKEEISSPEPTRSIKIFTTDSFAYTIRKYLWSKLGNNEQSWLWTHKYNDQNQMFLDFTNLKQEETIKKIGDFYNFFKNNLTSLPLSKKEYKPTETIRPNLYSYYLALGTAADWTFSDIRTFDTAFGIGPHVGWSQSILSPGTLKDIKDPNDPKKGASIEDLKKAGEQMPSADDVVWKNQLTRFNKNDKELNTFLVGSAGLIPIKSAPHKEKQTIKFLEWLFSGETKIKSANSPWKGRYIYEIFSQISGYNFTTKAALSKQTYDTLTKQIEQKQKRVDAIIKSDDKYSKINDPDWSTIYIDKAAAASLKDYLDFKEELNKDPNKNSIAFLFDDKKSLRINNHFTSSLFTLTRNLFGTAQTNDKFITKLRAEIQKLDKQ